MKDRAQLVKKKWRSNLKDNAGDNFFLNLEELSKTFTDLMIRTQTTLGKPLVNLGSTVDKWIFSASVISRMVGRILAMSILGMGLITLLAFLNGESPTLSRVLSVLLQSRLYQLFLVAAAIFNIRQILFRLRDRDSV